MGTRGRDAEQIVRVLVNNMGSSSTRRNSRRWSTKKMACWAFEEITARPKWREQLIAQHGELRRLILSIKG